jgi:hypothetical protein
MDKSAVTIKVQFVAPPLDRANATAVFVAPPLNVSTDSETFSNIRKVTGERVMVVAEI